MPTVGPFHNLYWNDQPASTVVITPPGSGKAGYPGWQSAVIAPSLFGAIGAVIDLWMERLRWALRLLRRVKGLDREQRLILERVLGSLESPAYPVARLAVRQTATTLGFNRPEAWKPLGTALKASPGRAENTFRHLNACTLLRDTLRAKGSTVTNPEMHLSVELAYQGFAAKGR